VIILIYLDWSATTPLSDVAKQVIIEHLDDFGNPSSSYEFGRKSRVLIEEARECIAKCINANPHEIYFTSGGSEANTWALSSYTSIASNIEHHSIRANYDNIRVNMNGIINPQSFSFIDHRYSKLFELASCMMVNNELGTIQPVKEIAAIMHGKGMLFHVDAVQALPHMTIDVKDINCDMLSASGHKFGAPKGVGFLYVKEGTKISPLIHGGKQEMGNRGGTENVLGIISMAAALEDTVTHMEGRNKHIAKLRDKMLHQLLKIEGTHLNGSLENRIVSNINIRFDGVPGARLVTLCDLYGICISSGSACNEGVATPSHVLKAIGLSDMEALNSVRITIGHQNTEEEIDQATNIITKLIERIREDET
jgi:cysteine desulfurase